MVRCGASPIGTTGPPPRAGACGTIPGRDAVVARVALTAAPIHVGWRALPWRVYPVAAAASAFGFDAGVPSGGPAGIVTHSAPVRPAYWSIAGMPGWRTV